jgi:chemotaxis protein methyltransferase CheR
MFSITLREARSLIHAIKSTYGTDLSGFAMASFRLRLSHILKSHAIRDIRALIGRLLEDQDYYETFLRDIFIGSPDLFRDPDFWIHLRDRLLPSILKSRLYPEIVVPESVTGNELYSLVVLLCEAGNDLRVDVVTTCRNKLIMDRIVDGKLTNIRYKNSRDNYNVFNPGSSIEDYFELRNATRHFRTDLLKGVEFRLQSPDQTACSEQTALVLYRNRMLYMNRELQSSRLRQLLQEMKEGTCFVTGTRETVEGFGLDHMYTVVSPDLKIYAKAREN